MNILTSTNARGYLVEILNVSEIFLHKCGPGSGVFVRRLVTAFWLFSFHRLYYLLLLAHLFEALYSGRLIRLLLVIILLQGLTLSKLLLLIILHLLLLLLKKHFLLSYLLHWVSAHSVFHSILTHRRFSFLRILLWLLWWVNELWELVGVLLIMVGDLLSSIISLFPFLHFLIIFINRFN